MRIRGLLVVLFLLALAAPAQAAGGASPGAAGIGDRLFPGLGNGGYDVLHYDLDLRYATSAPSQPIDGTVTIFARATQSLSRFDLDFAGKSLGGVTVDGAGAGWRRDGQELVITPRRALRKNGLFVVRVSHFVAVPTEPGDDTASTAFFIHADGSATAGQPDGEHYVFPSNDHPRDKATFTFRFDVPAGTTAVANGLPLGHWTRKGRTTWLYAERHPMATELTQLAVGNLNFSSPGRRPGILLRDVVPPSLEAEILPRLAIGPSQIDWMEDRVGRYPLDAMGSLVIRADLGFALETQGISLLDTYWFEDQPVGYGDATLLHELSHMWFGDSVAPYEWSDIWLNEGHASWYEFVYSEEQGFLADDTSTTRTRGLRHGRGADARGLRAQRPVAPRLRPGRPPDRRRPPVRPAGLPRRRARPVRAAPGGRRAHVRAHRARVGGALPRPRGDDGRLHRARLAGLPPRPARLPARVAVRHDDPADARATRTGRRTR